MSMMHSTIPQVTVLCHDCCNIAMQRTIFVVDDNSTNLSVAEEALENQYRVITLSSAEKMFTILEKITPDLILMDIEMPGMNGFEAMKKLKSSDVHAKIPVIFLTAMNEAVNEAYGIEVGAVDFIAKPFSVPVLLNRIKHHLHIDDLIRERTAQLVRLQNSIVFTLADIVESRDSTTGGHIERTTVYIEILIKALLEYGVYSDEIRTWDLESVISSARLHDVGKIAIPDSILNKPGSLTDDEYHTMKTHASAGEKIIDQMIHRSGDGEFLQNAKLSTAYHHEKWDGTGYPNKLKETAIPLHGRIVAIVDVYDALTTERSYKKALTHDEALGIITDNAGGHFDPHIVRVFSQISGRINEARVKLGL